MSESNDNKDETVFDAIRREARERDERDERENERENEARDNPQPSSNSNLLTPSELALMKRDFEQSSREIYAMVKEAIRRGELPATL